MLAARGTSQPNREVRRSVLGMAVNLVQHFELDPEEILAPFPFDLDYLERRDAALDWDDFFIIVDRVAERVGLEELAEATRHLNDIVSDVRVIFSAFIDPLRLYRFVNEVVGPSMNPMFHSENHIHDDGTVELAIDLREGLRDSYAFFYVNGYAQASIPTFIGLPPSELRLEVGPRGARYWLAPPRSRTLVSRISRGIRGLFARVAIEMIEADKRLLLQIYQDLWHAMEQERRQPDERTRKVAIAVERWGLTPRQGEVVDGLVRGLANKEIACELGCSVKTVEAHVTEILRRAGASSRTELLAAFFASPPEARASP